jgi:SAM-dependent methyltransferase
MTDWLAILRCPYCQGEFSFERVTAPRSGRAEFGTLRCACDRFPVLDGVPVIQRGRLGVFNHVTGEAEVAGLPIADVVRLIEDGHTETALLHALALPGLPAGLDGYLPWRIRHSEAMRSFAGWSGRRELTREILNRRDTIGAQDLFQFFFREGRPVSPAFGPYFMLRFGQPRYLAALALLSTIPSSDRPMLDIACGAGHFEHYLTQRDQPSDVIGTDLNFFHVWIARHWIAPKGRFVCANAVDGLPFASDAFTAVICSDAYHYLTPNRERVQSEIRRCSPHGTVVLTRVGNRSVMPNEGDELTVREYLDEFPEKDVWVCGEDELLKCYLQRSNPLMALPDGSAHPDECKWLSFVWNVSAALKNPPWSREDWPHAVGEIGVNPVYRSTIGDDGDLHVRFSFPDAWYAYENHAMLSYHPRHATISRAHMASRAAWRDDPAIRSLVESFVLVGLPERFRS